MHVDQSAGVDIVFSVLSACAAPVRAIFREAFAAAGLPYFNPHSLRNTLVRLGEERCQTPEQFKAWNQNLGHEGALTTLYSYGEVSGKRQGEIIQGLSKPRETAAVDEEVLADAVARKLEERRQSA